MPNTPNQILVDKPRVQWSLVKILNRKHSLVHLTYWKSNQKMKLEV